LITEVKSKSYFITDDKKQYNLSPVSMGKYTGLFFSLFSALILHTMLKENLCKKHTENKSLK